MGSASGPKNVVPISEPVPISDVFADGVAMIQKRDGFVRFVFTADRELYYVEPEGEDIQLMERVVVNRIIMPIEALERFLRQLHEAVRIARLPVPTPPLYDTH